MSKLLEIQTRLQADKTPLQAIIREEDCIGCTKCLPACPVDAIVGAAKQMHTIMTSECIGCQLCIEPCPVDCIDMVVVENAIYDPARVHIRYQAQQRRILEKTTNATSKEVAPSLQKKYIQEAVARVKAKRRMD